MMNRRSSHDKTSKKDRSGRWSQAQASLFEQLIQRYGKNWKKIHQHMRGRSLSQIRSHAQKFFDKIGHKKVEDYERRAKLLEAYETLEKEKRMTRKETNTLNYEEIMEKGEIKEEDIDGNHPYRVEAEQKITSIQSHAISHKIEEDIKSKGQDDAKREEMSSFHPKMPEGNSTNQCHNGFLMNLIYFHPGAFSHYELGLENFGRSHSNPNPYFFPGR